MWRKPEKFLSLKKKIVRGLDIYLNYSYTRKGNDPTHKERLYQPHHTFLWGNKRSLSNAEVIAESELIHNLKAMLWYRYLLERGDKSKTERGFAGVGVNFNVE